MLRSSLLDIQNNFNDDEIFRNELVIDFKKCKQFFSQKIALLELAQIAV